MKVLKFGGSSVANHQNIKAVLQIVQQISKQEKVVVIVSAFGKTTNNLIETAHTALENQSKIDEAISKIKEHHFAVISELIHSERQAVVKTHIHNLLNQLSAIYHGIYLLQELSDKTLAKVSSFGERMSSYIIAAAASEKLDAVHADSSTLINANGNYIDAEVNFENTDTAIQEFCNKNNNQIIIAGGFIAQNNQQEITTLGRGGSDYSAAIYAATLNAEELQIWTDVSGMFTANPAVVKQAFPIAEISYEEAMELSHFGAKVLYPPTIQPVLGKNIPIRIKNTFEPENPGTLISKSAKNGNPIKGISYIDNISLLTIEGSGMIGIPGFSKRLFETLSFHKINVVLITQASSEHSICVGIYSSDADVASQILNENFALEITQQKISSIYIENELSIIAIVGDHMKNHQGLSGQMFSALGKNNVNVRAIAQGASEKNISAVINANNAKKALNTLHEQFFEEKIKQLNLFVTGVGNVGERFLAQLQQQKDYLREHLKLNIRVIGIANSKKMYFNDEGIDLSHWKESLQQGETGGLEDFLNKTKSYNFRNSVFVDNTASAHVATMYESYLQNNIAVVTCNKIACASEFENYLKLKKVSNKYNAPFLFETNVGAGLPIIDTLKNLIASGDRVHKIQAVLSGTLNFVFNNFNDTNTFHDVVADAQAQGYTEPDPKIDLSGIDVARKILILARESGYQLELSNIKNNSFLPEESLNTTNNEDFYASLKKYENQFQELYKNAKNDNARLKYVAEFKDGKAHVGLQHITPEHPFYNLDGSDNIVLFYTDRYPVNPLQIKGAGAGAEVTASGIFADVIRIANF
ncbi:aspartate kinase [Tenacibaculum holothuriorum]|uniref:Aspartate kinase n=1 Tax=Tenacibaculum holothuriorum TaxID=1635173 RepID=A0A1Y2PC81_9FLAO|nr:bifunctional aspartate kinase/homoserine dehydrogenase I [Tenacibaculum holothuriorum]OSY88083.1 aspartate kinase [Tenacibaculum holothuriorum]